MKTTNLTYTRAVTELVFAGAIWGFGYVATVWSLQAAGPVALSGWRFVLAGLIGTIWSWRHLKELLSFLRVAWIPGIFLALMIFFQTWGLQYTTATKSSFITALYVLIVPLTEPFFVRQATSSAESRRRTRRLLFYAATSLFGVALMCGLLNQHDLDEKSKWNFGDFLTLLCALAASAHIIAIDLANRHKNEKAHGDAGGKMNDIRFNTAQSLCAGIPMFVVALAADPATMRLPSVLIETKLPLIGFLSLVIGSTLIGFALQFRAQKILSPSAASLLFLLESPFAAIFALLLLGENMSFTQLLGGCVILASIAMGVRHLSKAASPSNSLK
ncbi:MAG: DMT family transporter [Bdellovibrionales bacterium]|jgi:drug/metabolite transporter (DMT)-like permease|nr:DMT family transporter [Bdellovibrionales bacterium]